MVSDKGSGRASDDGARPDLLLFGIQALRLLIPSVGLFFLLCQVVQVLLRSLFARLQASSFLESRSGYQSIPSAGESITNAASNALPKTINGITFINGRVSAPPDENGILPVVVPVRSLRRGLIYTLFSLAAVTYIAEGGILIAHSIINMKWESKLRPGVYTYEEYYILGSAVALSAQTLYMAWQERSLGSGNFKRTYPVLIALSLWVGEVTLLSLVAKFISSHSGVSEPSIGSSSSSSSSTSSTAKPDIWTIGHLIAQSTRILTLTLLLLSFTSFLQRTDFKPNEYSALLAEAEQEAQQSRGASGTATPSNGYGTFGAARNGKPPGLGGKKGTPPIAKKEMSFAQRIRILGPYLWPKKSRTLQVVAFVCFLLLGVGRVVNFYVPRTYGNLVEDLTTSTPPWKNLMLYALLRFLQGNGGLTQVLGSNLWIPVAQYSEREMAQMTFSHLLNLSLSFQVKKKTGEVLRTLDRGSAINSFFQTLLFQLAPIGVDIVVAIIYFWTKFGVALAMLVAVVMTAYVTASIVLTKLRVKLRRDMNDKDKYTRGILADALGAWESIKYFTAEDREMKRYTDALKAYQKSEFKVIASLNFLNLLQNSIISLGLLVGALIVAFGVVQGKRTVGTFVMFLTYLNQLYGPLNILGTLYRVIQSNITDTDNLMKLLAEEKEIVDKPDAEVLMNARGGIELDHVNFSYDGKMTALKDLTVSIPPGTSVALVGESGAGKSTLLRLLYRFYEVTGGSIRIDGKDVRDLTQTSLRRAIGVVPQEAVLFNESIAYNIGYGKDGATQEEIEEAAKAARIYDRIQTFPDGWDTVVGERGVRLSGGEKQRVSIARAILKNPAILLLDEATSALDTQTEREIQSSLQHLAEGRTSIAIAHRLSTITYSDLILVLKDGEIIERGDHKTLLSLKGLYFNLWSKQIRAEEEAIDNGKDSLKLPIQEVSAAQASEAGTGTSTPAVQHHGHP